MKKILLIALLLVLIIAVSYVKTLREKEQKQTAFNAGVEQSQEVLSDYKNQTDSLLSLVEQKDKAYTDSLKNIDLSYQTEIDSLSNVLKEKESAITTLTQKTQEKAPVTQKSTGAKTLSLHEKILTYYKDRYTNLPGDLSTYEKKIALNEIREETADKFKITLAQLNKIRKDNKLNY